MYTVVGIHTLLPGTLWWGYRHYCQVQCGGDTDTIAVYAVHCTPYTVHRTLYTVHHTLYGVVGIKQYCQVQCGKDTDTNARYSVVGIQTLLSGTWNW